MLLAFSCTVAGLLGLRNADVSMSTQIFEVLAGQGIQNDERFTHIYRLIRRVLETDETVPFSMNPGALHTALMLNGLVDFFHALTHSDYNVHNPTLCRFRKTTYRNSALSYHRLYRMFRGSESLALIFLTDRRDCKRHELLIGVFLVYPRRQHLGSPRVDNGRNNVLRDCNYQVL